MVAWCHADSLPIAEQALTLARDLGAREAEVRALTVLGTDLAYLSRGEAGLPQLRQALQLAEEIGDHLGLERAYVNFTDVLTILGRPRESARLGQAGLEVIRRYGIYSALLVSNQIEALFAIGGWDEAERLSAAALHRITSSFPYSLLTIRAGVEIGRGELDAARAHLQAASATLREDRLFGRYDAYLADLALWEHRWTDADAAITDGLVQAHQREAAQIRVHRSQLAHPGAGTHHRRPPRGPGSRRGHPERHGLARPGRGRVRARPRPRPARVMVTGSRHLGTARPRAPRGILPLAPGRGARRGRRVTHRSGRATPARARYRGPDRSQAPAPGARTARPAGAARSRAPAGRVPQGAARPGGDPRPDCT